MTEQHPNDQAAPDGAPLADEPIPDQLPAGDAAAGTSGREWIGQLEAMIRDISTQAAPVARQVGAKAAELAALAAVKAGPAAQRAAEFTVDYGQRFADKAQSVAAELRAQDDAAGEGSVADPSTESSPPDDAVVTEVEVVDEETPPGA